MSELSALQRRFARMVGELIGEIYRRGYECSLGEAWRPVETAELYAEQGRGIASSLHTSRLAIDLILWHDDNVTFAPQDYRPIGEWWEDHGGAWGGRFNDYGHFSLAYGGRK